MEETKLSISKEPELFDAAEGLLHAYWNLNVDAEYLDDSEWRDIHQAANTLENVLAILEQDWTNKLDPKEVYRMARVASEQLDDVAAELSYPLESTLASSDTPVALRKLSKKVDGIKGDLSRLSVWIHFLAEKYEGEQDA